MCSRESVQTFTSTLPDEAAGEPGSPYWSQVAGFLGTIMVIISVRVCVCVSE